MPLPAYVAVKTTAPEDDPVIVTEHEAWSGFDNATNVHVVGEVNETDPRPLEDQLTTPEGR